jgi:hypothetical protein
MRPENVGPRKTSGASLPAVPLFVAERTSERSGQKWEHANEGSEFAAVPRLVASLGGALSNHMWLQTNDRRPIRYKRPSQQLRAAPPGDEALSPTATNAQARTPMAF